MIGSIDPLSLIIGAVLGAFMAIWLDLYVKRPELVIGGFGSGSRSDGTQGNSVSIHNKVGWFGISIRETRIFGLRIHPSFRLGLPFQKSLAQDCRAQLFLADTNEHICQLWWSGPDSSVEDVKSIRSGDSASLLIFIAKNGEKKYFPYQPKDRTTGEVKPPPEPTYFSGSKDFYISIHHSYNQTFRYNLRISEKFDGKLYLETERGGSLLAG
jgi:hypothetical protein